VALGLVVYILIMGLIGFMREFQDRHAALARVRGLREQLERDIAEVKGQLDPDAAQYMESLEREMSDAAINRPSLAMVMLELTRLIGKDAWCQSFEWRDGSVTIQIKETEEDVGLVRSLEFSPILGDVVQISKAVGPGGDVVRRFQMNARYDMAGEKHLPPPKKAAPAGGDDSTDAAPAAGEAAPAASGRPETGVRDRKRGVPPPPPPPPPGPIHR
jgi:hypothetical protein